MNPNTENRNGTGKEETRCQGVGKPIKRGNKPRGNIQEDCSSHSTQPGRNLGRLKIVTNCFNDTGYACPPDTRSCKTVIKSSLLAAPSVSKFILSVWVSGLYVQQKFTMVKSISKLYISISPSLYSHTSCTHIAIFQGSHNDHICSFV